MQAENVRDARAAKEESKMVKVLQNEEKRSTRELWEEVFPEDSSEFVDYYYTNKIADNIILVIEKDNRIISMLHLNPFNMQYQNYEFESHYIVAVATKVEYRHQGFMRELLKEAMNILYQNEEPFTFLMPADESIYTPFGFQFIYRQKELILPYLKSEAESIAKENLVTEYIITENTSIKNVRAANLSTENVKAENYKMQPKYKSNSLTCTYATWADARILAEFCSKFYRDRKYLSVVHNESYFVRLIKEQECQKGGIMLLKDAGKVIGYFNETSDPVVELREIIIRDEYKEFLPSIMKWRSDFFKKAITCRGFDFLPADRQVPIIMARILQIEKLFLLLTAQEDTVLNIGITDPLLEENNGVYKVEMGRKKTKAVKVKEDAELSVCISDLTGFLFGYVPLEKITDWDKIPMKTVSKLRNMIPVKKAFINEVV